MKSKKIFALLVSAALAVSFAGCGGNDQQSSGAEKAASSEVTDSAKDESKAELPELDTDPEAKKFVEERIDASKLGELSKLALSMFENKTLKVKFDIEKLSDEEESSEASDSSVDIAAFSDETTVVITKDGNKNYRIKLDLGLFTLDILNNKDGVYSVNRKTRSYSVLSSKDEESSSKESETSEEKVEKAVKTINDMTGGLLDDFDTDSLIKDPPKTELTYNGNGTESYKDEQYKYESYTVRSENSLLKDSSGSKKEKTSATAQVKVYFGDDDLIKLVHIEGESRKYDITVKELSLEVDESELSIPEEYELNEESSTIDLSALGVSIPQ